MKKKRADDLLIAQGFADSREKAAPLFMAGLVLAGTRRVDKSGDMLAADTVLTLKGKEHPWVSRGGLKLVKGLDFFNVDPTGAVCMDVGCSTGGFTDVLLSRGAAKVYAVDVGYGQLAQKLRTDERVVVLERTNARNLTTAEIPERVGMIVCDASFITLEKVLPTPLSFAMDGAVLIALIKPQFQVPKHLVGEGGIVRDPAVRQQACAEVEEWLKAQNGWTVSGVTESPIKGAEGNVEFLISAVFSEK